MGSKESCFGLEIGQDALEPTAQGSGLAVDFLSWKVNGRPAIASRVGVARLGPVSLEGRTSDSFPAKSIHR